MTTIINPWVFYWIDVLCRFNDFMDLINLIGIVAIPFLIAFASYGTHLMNENKEYGENDRDFKDGKALKSISMKILKPLICLWILSVLTLIFIPSKETMYTMLVAQNVTSENIEIATDTIKESVDYIFDKFNESEE